MDFVMYSQQKLQQHMKLHGPTEATQQKKVTRSQQGLE